MNINVRKLDFELKKAGIPIHGCSSDGRIDFKDEATKGQKDLARQILSSHISEWYLEKRQKAYPLPVEQLDMIWHLIDDGVLGQEAKNTEFYLKIKAIKDAYPKE